MMKIVLVVALVMSSPAGAEEVIHYTHNPMLDIQAFVDAEIKLANQDVLDTISRETAAVAACPKPATDKGGLFSNIEDTTGEANPPISTRLGNQEYAISKTKIEDGKFCYRLVSPVERTLTLEEGQLLATALALRANPTIQNYYKEQNEDTAALNAKVDDLFAAVKSKRNTDRLASKYGIFSLSDIDKEGADNWTSCQDLKEDSEAVRSAYRNTGYIYNSLYSWKGVVLTNGNCYWLVLPVQRGLNADESKLLDAAIKYGVTPPQSQIDNGFFPAEEQAEPKSSSAPKSDNPDAVTATSPLVNFGFPYSAIALVMQNDVNVGTAFQVSPNVYVTAAHVVVTGDDRPKSGLRLHPKYRMPSTNNGLRIDVQNPQPYYSLSSVQRTSNDYAFLRLNTAVPSDSYMQFHMLDSSLNIGFTTDSYGCSNYSLYDPYRFYWGSNFTNTYWNDVGCQWGGTVKNVAGYPAAPGGTSNINNKPYTSTNIGLYGGPGSDGRFYKLIKRCLQCLPVIGMTRSNISYGFSGSPIIGLNPYVTDLSPKIVGIVAEMATSSSGLVDGLASGFFDYNAGVFNSQINWVPSSLISISSPSEDGSYTSQNVPNLTANAGASTPQLVWRSDLDGLLGYGGNVSIAGRLRPGDHTITASIGSSVTVQSLPSSEDLSQSKRTAGATIKTVHITITTPASSTFNLAPATVLIPATQSQGKFTYNWSAPAYPSLNLQSSINGGAWAPSPPLAVPASATATDYISVGTNYVFRFMPNNDTNVLSTLSVQGVAAPSPVFSANPTTIVTNAASGNSTITWSAPGYAGLDWCGKLDSGAWLCGSLTTAASGSTVVSVPVGSRYGYRFYPQGSPNQGGAYNLLGELFIQAVGTQQPTFSANPTHIVVPTSGTSGNTVITWSAPTYSGLDWCGRVNNGAWAGGLQTGPVGSTVQPVPVGSTYGYRFYPSGQSGTCGAQNLLGELSVYATH